MRNFLARKDSDSAEPPRQVPSERALLRRARTGETDAFDQLFARYKDDVYACLWHLLDGDEALVEEAVGAVFLSVYQGLPRFRGEAAFGTWLYRIAVNEARAHRRQRRRQSGEMSLQEETLWAEASPQADDPAARVARAEEAQALVRAVRALPEPYRTPVTLRYFSGMAAGEVADVLKRPAGTVRSQVKRALELLRERLGGEWDS